MSVWDTSAHQSVTEAELLEGEPLDEDLLTKIGSNQEYAEAQRLLQKNAWSQGSDLWDHFTEPNTLGRWVMVGAPPHDSTNHLYTLDFSSDSIRSVQTRRPDLVESIFEFRVKMSVHSGSLQAYIGARQSTGGSRFYDATFERGTNSNTWKAAIHDSGGFVVDSADNLAGNYIDWDELRLDYTTTNVKFYINSVLAATLSTGLVTNQDMYCAVYAATASGQNVKIDRMSVRAIANDESP